MSSAAYYSEPPPTKSVIPMWVKNIPFLLMHLACFLVFLPDVHATPVAIGLCIGLYVLRMFGITAGYHRYFSHRAYKTSRFFQFVMAWLGCCAMQKGPLWWSSHHRHHHLHSDHEEDVHSPHVDTLWWSHIGWVLSKDYVHTDWQAIRDFSKYPELRWLDRNHWVPGLCLAILCYLVGGLSGLVWGFFVSTVITYHATFCINSFCHIIGNVRYKTTDKSKNSALMALITLGEGWHNNHHYYQSSANQGFFWWEFDVSYYMLKMLSWCGLVWDLRAVPKEKLHPKTEKLVEPAKAPALTSEAAPVITPIMASIQAAAHSVMQSLTHAAEVASQAAASAKQTAAEASHSASEALHHAAEAAAVKAKAAYQSLAHATEAASAAAASMKVSAADAAHAATDALFHAVEAAAAKARQAAQSASHALASAVEAAGHAADSVKQSAAQSASNAGSQAAGMVAQAVSSLRAKTAGAGA
ncbi:MAG TPA: fatty acid desaturase [Gemmatales bacterium]|nr:fatty acid desaturase [Gemmatales bacterium]